MYLGFLQVTLDDAGAAHAWHGEPILLDASLPEDIVARGFVDALGKPLEPLMAQPVGTTTVTLDGGRSACRFAECNLGDVIADSMIAQTKGEGTEIAILNGGGIRASISAGTITLGEVLEVLPFANTISTFKLRGADVRAMLEHGVGRAENPGNDGTGRFPQIAGLRFTWDAAEKPGQRVASVQVRQADGSYADLDPEAVYHVASIDFLRTGGDGYALLRDKAIDAYDGGALLSDALTALLSARSPIAPETDGRITRLH